MRGNDQQQLGVFSYVSLEERVPADHPLRAIRQLVDEIFGAMNREFDGLYAQRASVDPTGAAVAKPAPADSLHRPQ